MINQDKLYETFKKKWLVWKHFDENFRKSLYANNTHIYFMKTPFLSIKASIQDWNFFQAWMMTSLSRLVITSEIMALKVHMRLRRKKDFQQAR